MTAKLGEERIFHEAVEQEYNEGLAS